MYIVLFILLKFRIMNKYLILLLVTFMFACCSDDFVEDNSQYLKTKSSNSLAESPISQLGDIPCNLLLKETGEPNFLSARPSNWELRLHGYDDGSLRQRWYLRQINPKDTNSGYYIVLQGGSDRSSNRPIFINGGTNLNMQENDSQIPAIFYFENIPNTDFYYIYVVKSSSKEYIYSKAYGSGYVDLALKSNTGGRDKWEIKPVEKFKFSSISYTVEPSDGIKPLPSYVDAVTVSNQSDTQQSMTASFSRKASESSSFLRTEGFSIQESVTINVGIPLFNAQGNITSTTSESWQFGQSESKEDNRSYNFSLTVPAHRRYEARISVALYNASATYYVTYKGETSGKLITLKGKWHGIQAGKIDYSIIAENGSILKNFSGVPQNAVVVN